MAPRQQPHLWGFLLACRPAIHGGASRAPLRVAAKRVISRQHWEAHHANACWLLSGVLLLAAASLAAAQPQRAALACSCGGTPCGTSALFASNLAPMITAVSPSRPLPSRRFPALASLTPPPQTLPTPPPPTRYTGIDDYIPNRTGCRAAARLSVVVHLRSAGLCELSEVSGETCPAGGLPARCSRIRCTTLKHASLDPRPSLDD